MLKNKQRAHPVWCRPKLEKLDYWNAVNLCATITKNTLGYSNCMVCTVSVHISLPVELVSRRRWRVYRPKLWAVVFLQLCSSCIETFFTCLDCFADQVVNLLLLGEEFHGLGLVYHCDDTIHRTYILLHFTPFPFGWREESWALAKTF